MFSPVLSLPVGAPSTVAPGHFAEKESWNPGLDSYSFCDLGQRSLPEPHVPHLEDGDNYILLSWQLGVLDNWPPGCFQNIPRILLPGGPLQLLFPVSGILFLYACTSFLHISVSPSLTGLCEK